MKVFLLSTALLTFFLFLVFLSVKPALAAENNEKFKEYKIGEIKFDAVKDIDTDMGINLVLNKNSQIARNFYSGKMSVPASINAFLLKTKNQNILIDTGLNGGNIVKHLKEQGISPENINTILLTHMHSDHAGGLLDQNESKVFKNAKIFVSNNEMDYWLKTKKSKFHETIANEYKGQIEFLSFDGDNAEVVKNEVIAKKAFGHTPGHTIYEIHSGEDTILVIGDVLHIVNLQTADPSLSITYDVDPIKAAETREKVLKYAAERKIKIAGMHIPFSGIGRIVENKKDGGYKFNAE
jgi:glyoxylase-like metal-dependent hydrolase (beta-lactamase superfamily II)